MIAKESRRAHGRSSSRDLIKYLLNSQNNNERVIYSQFANCLGGEPALAMKEIEAVHAMNTRAKGNKMYHLIVSFREGDNPTPRSGPQKLDSAISASSGQAASLAADS